MRICDLAKSRVRYGYYRIYILLRREGWRVKHKRVHRLYRDEGLNLRLKRPRRPVSGAHRERQPAALRPNERWSMEFVSDALFDGRRLRALTVVDAFTREALVIEVDQGIKGEQVVAVVGRLALLRGAPSAIQVDNGPERSTAGPTKTGSRWTSRALASRPTMRWSSRSTAACATSA